MWDKKQHCVNCQALGMLKALSMAQEEGVEFDRGRLLNLLNLHLERLGADSTIVYTEKHHVGYYKLKEKD